MVGNMKKCILIMISILVVLFSFIACTNNSSSNNSAAVTNKYGGIYTKNQEPSTSDKGNTTKKHSKITESVTQKVSFSNIQNHSSKSESDNITSFESEISKNNNNTEILETTLKDNETTTKKAQSTSNTKSTTQSFTDDKGWVNKWY